VDTAAYRIAVVVSCVASLLVIWVNIVQSDVNPASTWYLGVPLVAIVSVAAARLRPRGMSRALFVTALAQAVALAIVLTVRDPQVTPWTAPVVRGFGLNASFCLLFAGCALLFRTAARRKSAPGTS